jgi:L-lactate dehydrogenase complex protein LldG
VSDGDARADVMAGIRRALGVTGQERPRQQAVANRLAARPRGVIPARGQLPDAERVALFRTKAETAAATVAMVPAAADVPVEIARFLRDNNLPATLRRGPDPRLSAMPWEATALDVLVGRSHGDDVNAVSHALGGVAETGTLALVSGPDNPTSLNFLPDTHIVIVAAADIAGDLETVFDRVPRGQGGAALPRTINLVTGPSRSADIEQTLILGAHGPRRLHIVIVES